MTKELFIIFVTSLLTTFLSGMELAFISANRLRIELDRKQGVFATRIIKKFIENSPRFITTMLICYNFSLVVYGIFFIKIMTPYFSLFISNQILLTIIQIVLITFIILIFTDLIPKIIIKNSANKVLYIFSVPIYIFYFLLAPVTRFTIWFSNLLLKLFFNVSIQKSEKAVFGKIDLNNFLNENIQTSHIGNEVDNDFKIFQNALQFSKVKVRECFVPRTEIVAIEVTESLEELKKLFIETGFSKILIYKESIDNIIGYFHSSELFKKPKTIKECLNEMPIVPETMAANKLLTQFIQQQKSIALVVDEFGGTAGIVTLEDVMEEIFGEIEDEHDHIDLDEQKISNNEYIFSGRHEIDYLNEKYFLNIPVNDDYETLAGFILHHHQSIPSVKDVIIARNFKFEILKISTTRIELVKLVILKSD